eukprot:GHVN01086774.1.p1 GENE.GHVN01086774.1~~GHVN01086774.1.p1  ORF type:complete len:153 (-),score=20.22 GHVN01086774.1:191-649(-)
MSFGHKIIVRRSTPWSIYSVKNCLSLAHPHTSLHRRDHQLRHFSENPHQQRLREIVSNEGIERPAVLRQQVGELELIHKALSDKPFAVPLGIVLEDFRELELKRKQVAYLQGSRDMSEDISHKKTIKFVATMLGGFALYNFSPLAFAVRELY